MSFCLSWCVPPWLYPVCASWTWLNISFPILGKFSAIISSNIFSGPFSLPSPFGTPIMRMLVHLSCPRDLLGCLYFFSFFFFSVFCSVAVISTILSSRSSTCSSALVILLLISSSVLEKKMAPDSSILAWRIPGTEEPGRLPSMGSHRVGHN